MCYLLFPHPNPFLAFLRILLSERRLPLLLNFRALEALIPHHIILLEDERHVYSINSYDQCRVNRSWFTFHNPPEKCTTLKESAAAAAASEDAWIITCRVVIKLHRLRTNVTSKFRLTSFYFFYFYKLYYYYYYLILIFPVAFRWSVVRFVY